MYEITRWRKREIDKQQPRWDCEVSNEVTFKVGRDNPLRAVLSSSSLHHLGLAVLLEGPCSFFFSIPVVLVQWQPTFGLPLAPAPILKLSIPALLLLAARGTMHSLASLQLRRGQRKNVDCLTNEKNSVTSPTAEGIISSWLGWHLCNIQGCHVFQVTRPHTCNDITCTLEEL